jgi:hypothetical protein
MLQVVRVYLGHDVWVIAPCSTETVVIGAHAFALAVAGTATPKLHGKTALGGPDET